MVVQDLPSVEEVYHEVVPSELTSRVNFHAHDMFTPQTVQADVYLIRVVLHDWPDKYVVQVLQNLIPVLRRGVHVIVFDLVMPPEVDERGNGVLPLPVQATLAAVDLQMHVLFNSRERTIGDWKMLTQRPMPALN